MISWQIFGIILLIVIGIIIGYYSFRNINDTLGKDQKHPKGHYISLGIAIGPGIGVALGLILKNMALGIAIGLGMGASIGAALEKKYEKSLRPLTLKEEKFKRYALIFGIGMLLIGIIMIIITYNLIKDL